MYVCVAPLQHIGVVWAHHKNTVAVVELDLVQALLLLVLSSQYIFLFIYVLRHFRATRSVFKSEMFTFIIPTFWRTKVVPSGWWIGH